MWNSTGAEAEHAVIWVAAIAAVLAATWWILSVVAWALLLSRAGGQSADLTPDPGHRLGWTLPGSQRLARALVAPSLLLFGLGTACSDSPDAEVPTLRWVDETASQTADQTTSQTTTSQTIDQTIDQTTTTGQQSPTSSTAVTSTTRTPTTETQTDSPPVAPSPNSSANSTGFTEPAVAHHVVVTGDHLWSIATEHLARRTGGEPSSQQIASYWRQLIEQNRSILLSGDPNVIHVGERLVLP